MISRDSWGTILSYDASWPQRREGYWGAFWHGRTHTTVLWVICRGLNARPFFNSREVLWIGNWVSFRVSGKGFAAGSVNHGWTPYWVYHPELMWRKVMRGTGCSLFARADRSGRSFEQGVRRPTSLAQVTVKAAVFQNQQFYHFLQNLNCTEPIFDLAQEIIFQEPPLHIVSECSGPPEIFAKFGIPAWWRISHSHETCSFVAGSKNSAKRGKVASCQWSNESTCVFNFSFLSMISSQNMVIWHFGLKFSVPWDRGCSPDG